MTTPTSFSKQLNSFLKNKNANTIHNLELVFGERSFAIVYLLLMAIPALPIPTGGITHVLEIICVLLATEQIIGLSGIWLPKRYRSRELPAFIVTKALPALTKRVAWLEKYGRRRGANIINNKWFARFAGLIVLASTLSAFLAPPFSGLDTLPALGVVVLSVGIIIEDLLFIIAGVFIGLLGIMINVTIGAELFGYAERFIKQSTTAQRYWFFGAVTFILLVFFMRHIMSKSSSK